MSDVLDFGRDERRDLADFNCRWWFDVDVRDHMHSDYYEISFVTEGEQTNTVEGVPYLQRIGDVMIIKPNVTHNVSSSEQSPARHCNIAVKREYFESFMKNKQQISHIFEREPLIFLTLDYKTFAFVAQTLSEVDNAKYDALSYTLLESALLAIASRIMMINTEAIGSLRSAEYYCRDALNKINNNSYITKSASEIYEAYPISHTAFITEFKRLTSKTLVAFLTEKKLDCAKGLLLNSDMAVGEIASYLGYDSVSHFVKIFKCHFDMTPRLYRATARTASAGDIFSDEPKCSKKKAQK